MRKTLSTLIAAAALALSLGPPAKAQSVLNGCFDVTGGTVKRFCLEIRPNALSEPMAFGTVFNTDDSWAIFHSRVDTFRTSGPLYRFTNGTAFGQAYRFPSPPTVAGSVSIEWSTTQAGTIDLGVGPVPFARRQFTANGLVLGTPYNTPPTSWYVSRIRNEEGFEQAEEPGVGYFFEGQGTAGELHIAGYDETGQPKWYAINGAMPMNAGHIGFMTGTLRLGGTEADVGSMMVQGRQSATLAIYPPGETGLLGFNRERWLTRFNF